jgi:SAM-dependent methyltransferase
MFDEKRWAEVPAVVDAALRLAGTKAGAAVLDTCCGVGRHSVEFAGRGFKVTGVDITRPYLEAARESAEAAHVTPEFLHADIRSFRRPGAFDLAVNLFTSFGYFATPEEDLAALGNIRASLAPGGAFILETTGKETAARDFIEGEWFERLGWTVLTEYKVIGAWEGLMNRWILLRGAERIDRSFVLRLYSGLEMKRALLEAGFASAEIYGSLEGAPYDEKAGSLVALARVAG